MARVYSDQTREYRNKYNKEGRKYAKDQPAMRPFTATDIYLIMRRRLKGGNILSDIQIAKLLKRSVQSVQMKRFKLTQSGWGTK